MGGDAVHTGAITPNEAFLSTPPHGRRRPAHAQVRRWRTVSIHASAWEATQTQQRLPEPEMFLSTPPHGRRLSSGATKGVDCGFYPRLRMGGDLRFHVQERAVREVSIHASAWEATPMPDAYSLVERVSIHASAWEATVATSWLCTAGGFLSTPPHGRRREVPLILDQSYFITFCSVSIHASAWEATPSSITHQKIS